MYYIRLTEDESNSLVYYCRNCGNEDTTLITNNISVSKVTIQSNNDEFNHIINKYTKLDPTLPRNNKIKCPNIECSTNTKEVERENIYLRYDEVNIKYLYLCCICDTSWKISNVQ
jgi:hypothetical protein